jgi:membrane-bound lytic murein transglycosylase B
MNLANIPLAARVGAGSIAALAALGGGAAAATHLGGGTATAGATTTTPPVVATASPSPSPSGAARNAAAQAARRAIIQAEAQVLGITAKQLTADLRAGKTVQQLAADKGLSQDQFRTQLQQALKPLMDQEVAAGTLTSTQEQRALQRLATTIPNWSQAGAAKPSPSPTA